MPPIKTKETSYKTRCQVQALRFSAGWTYARIAEDQNLGISTVRDICNSPATPKKRKGRPFSIDSPTRRHLVATATQDAAHRQMPFQEIAELCGVQASERTLRKAFALEGYKRRKARKKVFLTDAAKAKRLRFALAHRHWGVEEWRKVIWTDESYVWLSGSRGTVWITRRPGEEYHESCIAPKFKKKNAIMIWGGILGGQKTPLVLWQRDNWGTITAHSYVEHVLAPVLWPFWYHESRRRGESLWVMEDGASAHRAIYTQAFRQLHHMLKMDWPPSSPDLNPIEDVWNLLKDNINARQPRPRGKDEMAIAVQEEWDRIPAADILGFIDTMPQRIAAVIAANGGHTAW